MYTTSQLLDKINRRLSEFSLEREPNTLYQPIRYELSLGGKRIRPVLMLMAYNLYREDVSQAYAPAIGIEIYHNHTLLHDDVMDRADLRRGKPTVHKVWGDNTAILSGDAMLILAFRQMTLVLPEYQREVMNIFSQTALEICEGQQLDMDFESRSGVSEGEYIEMIRLKTGVLLAASLHIGALLAGASAEDAKNLYQFGMQIGIAFQLQDDLLDVYGDPVVFGKEIGGDILCNKKTYMLIQAWNRADEAQRKELKQWMDAADYLPLEKIAAMTRLYDQLGIREACERKMRTHYELAMEKLAAVSVDEERKRELKSLTERLMYRQA
ncbi:MAG: polyprenyl synthetase family protein [Mediterranea sp.]|jgi:geranylgeranyl diphosphate synthase type II|nr:polyprenyl synthetase family protein [Mediterranea sp.]